jgi:hypothetical protein
MPFPTIQAATYHRFQVSFQPGLRIGVVGSQQKEGKENTIMKWVKNNKFKKMYLKELMAI